VALKKVYSLKKVDIVVDALLKVDTLVERASVIFGILENL
jgi:hypothetical protein